MPRAKKSKGLTLGDIFKFIFQIRATQLIYVLLLIAVFALGYLLSRVQMLEKGASGGVNSEAIRLAEDALNKIANNSTGDNAKVAKDTLQQLQLNQVAAAPTTAPGQPSVPDPKDVLKKLTNGHYPVKGPSDAKVKIVEFADFRCPFCERFFTDTESQLLKDYVDTGKASFAFRNYEFLGDASVFAGNAAECANEQGKFWEFHDWLYKNQPPESDTSMYNVDKMTEAAGTLGMNTDQFSSCLSTKKYDKNVSKDLADGQDVGVSGTPTFYVNGIQLVGAQPYSAFQQTIDSELKK